MPPLGNGLPRRPARDVVQDVADKYARSAKRGPTVAHRGIGNARPTQGFAHRGSPLSLDAVST